MTSLPIQTERLLIRRLRTDDAAALSRYRSIPDVARYQDWPNYSLEQAIALIAMMEQSSPEVTGEWFQFGIELRETGELIGDIGFLNTDADGRSWVGFTLDQRYWGLGLAREAVSTVLDYYGSIGIATVWASTDPANVASRTLLKRLGFTLVEETTGDSIYRKLLAH
jgi:RimJ/RimL family protein N-acetyltransferase